MTTTKGQILSYLKSSQGEWVSGGQLSQKMGVTRSALWKQVVCLRKEGYGIESSPGKGYLFQRVPDLLLPHEIQDGLATEVFGRTQIVVFPETESTNDRAKELAAKGAPEGTVVLAEEQTRGRGRRGRTWFSPAGEGIYCSLVLRPRMPLAEATGITLMAAVAAAERIGAEASFPIRVKWPNDLLMNGKKIGGILTEVSTDMDVVDHMVVGWGLNVNIPPQRFPPEIAPGATSLFMETGKTFSRVKLLQGYLAAFEDFYGTFRQGGFAPILKRWNEYAEIIGRRIRVEDSTGIQVTGKVIDIDLNGALILRGPRGEIQRIFSGDVTLIETLRARPEREPAEGRRS